MFSYRNRYTVTLHRCDEHEQPKTGPHPETLVQAYSHVLELARYGTRTLRVSVRAQDSVHARSAFTPRFRS